MLETILRRIAVTCAVLLLFGFAGDRTTWVLKRGAATEGAVYNLATTFCGIIALTGLAVALNTRPRRLIPLLGLLATIGAFCLTILVAGVSVWALMQGEVWFYGAASQYTSPLGDFAGEAFASAESVFPAQAPYVFTAAAIVGAVATLGLALLWLVNDRHEREAVAVG